LSHQTEALLPANEFNALSEKSSELDFSGRVDEHRKASAVNLMWPLCSADDGNDGSYHHGGKYLILDQILVSRGLLKGSPLKIIADSTEIVRLPAMEQGKNKKPHRFGRPSRGNLDLAGYSDHFPVGVRLGVVE